MKKSLNFILIGLSILLFSCGDSDSSTIETSDTESTEINIDTTSNVLVEEVVIDSIITIDLAKLFAKIDNDTVYNVPFHLDSIYLSSFEEISASTLTNEEVHYLSANLIDNDITSWSSFNIQTFIKIDSMKLMGTYEDYVDNLDIAMMKESDANIHQKVIIDKNNYILLWSISYSTYEACPFASGTVVYGTYFSNNTALNTAVLGENSSGGDAPYWGGTLITSQISSTAIVTQKHEENGGEMDEETGEDIIETTDNTYNITLTESGFNVVN